MSDPISLFGSPSAVAPTRRSKVKEVCAKYQIDEQYSFYFDQLSKYDVVVLCDDSTSMREALKTAGKTRWDELKVMVDTMVDIVTTIDPNGVDVYFLNREPLLHVADPTILESSFKTPPNGRTPIVPALRRILHDRKLKASGKSLLILIATDGVPTDENYQPDTATLETVLRRERDRNTYVTFLSCTDDKETVEYLEKLDKNIPNVDVVDDYKTELEQIKQVRGSDFPFSKGLYICKALFGSITPWFDLLDEKP